MKKVTKNKKCGIYQIKNILDSKIYIGSSTRIYGRWRHHKSLLKNNRHHNKHLQSAWNKYGEDSFVYEILEECTPELLLEKEEFYIEEFSCLDDEYGYNIAIRPGLPFYGKRHSELARKNQSIKNSGQNNPHWGKNLSFEHRKAISDARKSFSNEQEREIYEKHEKGETIASLARFYKRHPTTIRRSIDRYIKFRKENERHAEKENTNQNARQLLLTEEG